MENLVKLHFTTIKIPKIRLYLILNFDIIIKDKIVLLTLSDKTINM